MINIFGGDLYIFFSLITFNLVFATFFIFNSYSMIHLIMLIEISMLGSAIMVPAIGSVLTNFPDGEIFALFTIAVAAAESALAISFYLALKYQKPVIK